MKAPGFRLWLLRLGSVKALGIAGEQFRLSAHKVEHRSHGWVVRVEPFGSDRFAFVVVHAGLDAVEARSVTVRSPRLGEG